MKSKWILHVIVLLIIAAIGIAPWVSVAIAGTVASANGCELNEGSINPCMINGEDWGETLYGMGLMGWLGLATCPLSIGAMAVYIVVLVIVWAVRRSREKASRPPAP